MENVILCLIMLGVGSSCVGGDNRNEEYKAGSITKARNKVAQGGAQRSGWQWNKNCAGKEGDALMKVGLYFLSKETMRMTPSNSYMNWFSLEYLRNCVCPQPELINSNKSIICEQGLKIKTIMT